MLLIFCFSQAIHANAKVRPHDGHARGIEALPPSILAPTTDLLSFLSKASGNPDEVFKCQVSAASHVS